MKKQPTRSSRLFFIEFLIVLFFFLIISTVCLKLFVQAHRITKHADDLSNAQTMAASAAELLLAGYTMEDAQRLCEDEFEEDDYILKIAENSAANNSYFSISVYDPNGELLYELSVTTHTPVSQKEALAYNKEGFADSQDTLAANQTANSADKQLSNDTADQEVLP